MRDYILEIAVLSLGASYRVASLAEVCALAALMCTFLAAILTFSVPCLPTASLRSSYICFYLVYSLENIFGVVVQ
ncbi:hypothetical protein K438DRAFT_1977335 [Mycena galopus ATCC 62051]|nr:hypothetical protein K438DRAFT_1977335 [Mycena galopus ATCC 62051]